MADPNLAAPLPVPAARPLAPRPSRRGLFWGAVLIAVVALVCGLVVAYLGYTATGGPDGAVRGYYAALASGDAPRALAYGDAPIGSRTLITSTVLREQERIAPLRDFGIIAVDQHGDQARVSVVYTLRFATGTQQISDTVTVHQVNGDWRLVTPAVPTMISVQQAYDRMTFLGGAVPDGPVLLFPGALPIHFDTPYLQLSAASDSVSFATKTVADVTVEVSQAGRDAVATALRSKLHDCFTAAKPDPLCPVPNDQIVPGSLHGTTAGDVSTAMTLSLDSSPTGEITVSGQLNFTGKYNQLSFDNVATPHSGQLMIPLSSATYAVQPISLRWTATT